MKFSGRKRCANLAVDGVAKRGFAQEVEDATGLSRGISRSQLNSGKRETSTGQARGIFERKGLSGRASFVGEQ